MQTAAASRGPAAQAAFNYASNFTRNSHDFINNTVSKLYAPRGGIPPAQAIGAAFGDDGSTLQALRRQMPLAADDLAAYKLRDAALATPGRQNAAGTLNSPGTFTTDMAKLSPTSHDALFGGDPALAQRVADLRTSANSMRQTERFLNTGAGAHLGTLAAWEGAMRIPGALVRMAQGEPGGWAELGSAALPLLAGPTMSRLATSPFFTNLMSRVPPFAPATAAQRRAAAVTYPTISGLLSQ